MIFIFHIHQNEFNIMLHACPKFFEPYLLKPTSKIKLLRIILMDKTKYFKKGDKLEKFKFI